VLIAFIVLPSFQIIVPISSLLTFNSNKVHRSSSFCSISTSLGFFTKDVIINLRNSVASIFLKLKR
ncbi:TPA: hypothetical protein DCZ31_00305, partial [Patescibacteria group bacterium]|nr:hypothetical protein [Candidatus Gracilibacteria bacterium]